MATEPSEAPRRPKSFRKQLLVWAWNAINAAVGGAATAGAAVMTGAAIGAATFTPRQIWSTVLAGSATALFNYVRTNSLPEMFDSED